MHHGSRQPLDYVNFVWTIFGLCTVHSGMAIILNHISVHTYAYVMWLRSLQFALYVPSSQITIVWPLCVMCSLSISTVSKKFQLNANSLNIHNIIPLQNCVFVHTPKHCHSPAQLFFHLFCLSLSVSHLKFSFGPNFVVCDQKLNKFQLHYGPFCPFYGIVCWIMDLGRIHV